MNQQLIDKLLHKAGARFGAEGIDYSSFTSSKFAELLIKEVHYVIFVGGVENLDIVLEHFGVEE
jgi:hypothetical protein